MEVEEVEVDVGAISTVWFDRAQTSEEQLGRHINWDIH